MQLNGIGRMHVKAPLAAANGHEQRNQMFLTWVKATPQHRELRALVFKSHSYLQQGLWVTGIPAYSPYPRRLEILTNC